MGPTQEDVAKKAKVSRALVSLVMRDAPNVSEQRRRRVLRAAEELGYRPNAYARSLASKRLHTIGVLINDVTNPYFGGVYSSLATAAEAAGFDLLVAPGTRSAAKESALVRTLLEHRVAGLALLSPLMSTAELRGLTASWPTVLIGREASIAGVDVVTTDEHQAARAACWSTSPALGHRDIVHITGGGEPLGPGPRQGLPRGHARARAGATRDRRGVHPRGRPGGRPARSSTMSPLPTAVVAANDLIAVGAMGVFESHGLGSRTTSAWSATTTHRSPGSTWCSSPASARASTPRRCRSPHSEAWDVARHASRRLPSSRQGWCPASTMLTME